MLPDRVSNPGPLTYESDALPIALCGLYTSNTFIIELNDLRKITCLRKSEVSVERISDCKVIEKMVEHGMVIYLQSTLVIWKSKGPSETVRDIRTSTYQICSIVEKKTI